ncbi:MAG: acetyltransferase [Trueperaceae bacterium]
MMTTPTKPVLLLGAGGHASVLLDALQQSGADIAGITDPNEKLWGQQVMGVDVLGGDEKILDIHPERILLVNALGSTKDTRVRRNLFEQWKQKGYSFASVIHPKAIVAQGVQLGEGVQLLAGAIVNPRVSLAPNVLVNTGAILEHHCKVGSHTHVAPGVRVAGNVTIGQGTHLGIGCVILHNLTIGDECIVGGGAVVIKSVKAGHTVVGVPARVLEKVSPKK